MADVDKDSMKNYHIASEKINPDASRYPYCIVWTPIPVLSWVTRLPLWKAAFKAKPPNIKRASDSSISLAS